MITSRRRIDPKDEAVALVYTVLASLKDLTMIAIMIYLVTWELKASRTGNFRSGRKVGLSSSEACFRPVAAYGCGAGLIELSDSTAPLYANISALPICYTSSLVTSPTTKTEEKAQFYSFCFDDGSDSVVGTDFDSLPGAGTSMKQYPSAQSLPNDLQCVFDVDQPGGDGGGFNISSFLFEQQLDEMFPQIGLAHRNYFPFSAVLIGLCCVSIVLRITKNVASSKYSSDDRGSMYGGSSRGRSGSNRGAGGGSSGGSMSRGVDPSRSHSNVSGTSARQAEEDIVSRTSVALHLLVACLLLASASMMTLIADEHCPVDATEASYSVRGNVDYDSKGYTEAQLFSLCSGLRACDLSVRSVVSIDGSSLVDKESAGGFGYRRATTFFACLLFLYVLVHFAVSAGVLDFLFDREGTLKLCCFTGGRGRGRIEAHGGRQSQWVRLTAVRRTGNQSMRALPRQRDRDSREHMTTWKRVIAMMKRLRGGANGGGQGTDPQPSSPGRRRGGAGIGNSNYISSDGYRNRVPRASGLSVERVGASVGGTSASYAREYGLDDDEDWWGDHLHRGSHNPEAGLRDGSDQYFQYTITSFEQFHSHRRLRRRNLTLLGLYLGFDLDQLDGLFIGEEDKEKKEGKGDGRSLLPQTGYLQIDNGAGCDGDVESPPVAITDNDTSTGGGGRDERKEGEEDGEVEGEGDMVSDSLLLLLFDGENMCPICLQRFEARSQRHQKQLQQRIAMLKAASSSSSATRGGAGGGGQGNSSSSSSVVPASDSRWGGMDPLDMPVGWSGLPVEDGAVADTVWSFGTLSEVCHLIREKDNEDREMHTDGDTAATVGGVEDGAGTLELDRESHKPEPEQEQEQKQEQEQEQEAESGPRDWQALLASSGNEEVDLAHTPVMLECGHVYHTECIRSWTELSNSCPVCRCHIEEGDII